MATPVRIIITAAILLATMGISHAQDTPKSKVLRIGLPYPYYLTNPLPDEEPLALDFLTDITLGTHSEDAGANWRTQKQPLYSNHQRVFPAFSITEERDDGRTFFAELKPNVFFHDGSVATLDDVEFSLKRNFKRSTAFHRTKFTKLPPLSFSISSDRPEDWVMLLNAPLLKPGGAGKKSISAGPYIITDVDRKKRRVRLKAFEKYVNGPPLAPEVEYTFYDSSEAAMFDFLADETDFMCRLSKGQEKLIGEFSGKQVVRYASQDPFMLIFNTANPPMDDIRVRKAISLLMDRHGLVSKSQSLQGNAIPTQYQFAMSEPVTMPHADPPAPGEAFKLLQKAGYTRTAKGWEKNGKPIQLSMLISTHHSLYIPEARMVSRWLNEAGLNITFNLTPIVDYNDPRVLNKFHVLFGTIYDKMDFENNSAYFEPAAHDNIFQSTNPYPAVLLAGTRGSLITTDTKEEIIRKIADFSYSAPLFYPVEYCIGKDTIGYENAFFRSPIIYSVINRSAPSDPLQSQTGPKANSR